MISYSDITYNEINKIKDLWELNRRYHEESSDNFGFQYKNLRFEDRIKSFKSIDKENLLITIITNNREYIGYCISLIENENGELCSMHIKQKFRGKGFGKVIALKHLEWMKARECKTIKVIVSQENNNTISFYKSLGFKSNTITMEI